MCAWLHVPPSLKLYITLTFPPTFWRHFLRAIWNVIPWAIVLILPQIKLNSQHSCCAIFFSVDSWIYLPTWQIQTKTDKMHESAVFKTLDIKQQSRTMIYERWKQTRWVPGLPQFTMLVEFAGHTQGRGTEEITGKPLNWDRQRQQVFRQESMREESCTEREPQRPAENLLQIRAWVWGSNQRVWRKNHEN